MNVMTPTKRLRSTWYIIYIIYIVYVTNIEEIVALLWSGLGHIHILAMGCSAVENRGIGNGSSKLSFETEDCSGMTWAESAEGWKTEGLCLMKVEIKHDLAGRNKNRN